MKASRNFLGLIIAGLLLVACGQSGSLYLPQNAPPQQHNNEQGK